MMNFVTERDHEIRTCRICIVDIPCFVENHFGQYFQNCLNTALARRCKSSLQLQCDYLRLLWCFLKENLANIMSYFLILKLVLSYAELGMTLDAGSFLDGPDMWVR
jgi:hypothetical protein